MYDELVKRLKETSEWSNIEWEDYSDDAKETMREAADAIEELQIAEKKYLANISTLETEIQHLKRERE